MGGVLGPLAAGTSGDSRRINNKCGKTNMDGKGGEVCRVGDRLWEVRGGLVGEGGWGAPPRGDSREPGAECEMWLETGRPSSFLASRPRARPPDCTLGRGNGGGSVL